jgi:large subunit ribosomal protein L25
MKEFNITGKERNKTGRKNSQRERRDSLVPCVIYGGKENIHFSTQLNSFNNLVYTPNVYLININIEGKNHKAILQDVQFHPVTDKIIHADFYEVFDDKEVTISIPVKLTGSSPGVQKGGLLREKRRTLSVRGLPKNLPDYLEVDISGLEIDDNVHIGDLSFDNLEIMDPGEAMIVTIISLKRLEKALEEAEAAAEEAGEGAEEAVAAEGETAPAQEGAGEAAAEEGQESGSEESKEE